MGDERCPTPDKHIDVKRNKSARGVNTMWVNDVNKTFKALEDTSTIEFELVLNVLTLMVLQQGHSVAEYTASRLKKEQRIKNNTNLVTMMYRLTEKSFRSSM